MKKITSLLFCMFYAGVIITGAQTITTVASGFAGPIGICKDQNGNLFVAESGSGANDGKITMIDSLGAKYTIVYGLPSYFDTLTQRGEFYLCNLTGFPFITGSAQIVMIDSLGNITPQVSGLTQAVDMEMDSLNNIYVLQFGLYDSTFMPIMGSASIVRIMAAGGVDSLATGFGPSSGMTQDGTGGFYVTELMTGNVIHISNINKVEEIKNNTVSGLSAYPNPFNDVISLTYSW